MLVRKHGFNMAADDRVIRVGCLGGSEIRGQSGEVREGCQTEKARKVRGQGGHDA